MDILVSVAGRVAVECDALALLLAAGAHLAPGDDQLDGALGGAISKALASGDFGGKLGECLVVYPAQGARRAILVGLGDPANMSPAALRSAAGAAARKARDVNSKSWQMAAPGIAIAGDVTAQALTEGAMLGLYRFRGYKSVPDKDQKEDPESLTLLVSDTTQVAAAELGVARGVATGKGVVLARNMVNEPGNRMTPTAMAEVAKELAAQTGLEFSVLERSEMVELGMGIFMAVAAASDEPPKMIILEHNAGRADLPTLVLVGKGVTFDSGGISLKPGEDMWRMKDDMSGAAAVISTLGVAARLALPLHVIGLAPCTENLPGGNAQKPGDVFVGMTGKSMEVISTDAEGRMLLADALAYAGRFQPAAVVDIATLTGAQAIALGPQAAGLFVNDEKLAERLLVAADTSAERLWRLPLYPEYMDSIRSQVADVKNSGGRTNGIGTSAVFLQHFTDGYPWAHIDMASMAWSEEDRPAQPKGAAGYGVRLLTAFLESWQ